MIESLFDKPIGFVLFEIWKEKSSGTLQISSEGKLKAFFISEGKIVEGLSNKKGESLEDFLIWKGEVPADFVELSVKEGESLRTFILEKGFLTQSNLKELERQRLLKMVRDAFTWVKGEYSFEEGYPEGDVNLDIIEALRYAVSKVEDREFYRPYITSLDKIMKAKVGKAEGLTSEEVMMLEDLRFAKKINRAISEFPLGEFKALKIIIFLYVLGLIGEAEQEEELEEIEVLEEKKENKGKRDKVFLIFLIIAACAFLAVLGFFYFRGKAEKRFNPVRAVKPIAKPAKKISFPRERIKESQAPSEVKRSEKKSLLSPDPLSLVRKGKIRDAGIIWLKKLRGKSGFTLLLELDCQRENIVEAFSSKAPELFAIPYRMGNRICYRICYGVYPTKEKAQRAVSKIPHNFKMAVVYSLEKAISEAPVE